MMNKTYEKGIYIHIPFCVHKCIYCDFLSAPAGDAVKYAYTKALINEIRNTADGQVKDKITSIFFGGGTPSVLPDGCIADILAAVRDCFDVLAADTYNSVTDSASNSEYVKIGYGESGYDTREYDYQEEHRFVSTKDFPLSTFAADCDTASYSNIRSYIEEGMLPPAGAVRVEEMINYFDYDYVSGPEAGKKFAVYTEYADCPWNKDTKLMMVGLNTAAIDMSEKKASNLVFLIDTSGSMYEENKLRIQMFYLSFAHDKTDKIKKIKSA